MDRKPQLDLPLSKLAQAIAWALDRWPTYVIGDPRRA
jgi:hypothetical protein